MKLYEKLSSIVFLRNSYVFKFLFVAFIGIHIPLIGILFFILYVKNDFSPTNLLVFALMMTLVATVLTLIALKKLIQPIELASKALNDYRLKRMLTKLPIHFVDEAGLLLANINDSILENKNFIREKQELIYLLSHDLRNFAANPQSLAKLILETDPSQEVKDLAHLICESSNDQFQYIGNFIRMLKEQDEILETALALKEINLEHIIDSVSHQLNQNFLAKKIDFIKKIDFVLVKLRIDSELLARVIFNILNNAIKFSFSNSVIELRVYTEEEKLYIEIADNGIGFESVDVEKIFSKFTKMSRLGTSNESSTGIGLYLCKQIVERNDGSLLARSEGNGKGATFTVVFPLIA